MKSLYILLILSGLIAACQWTLEPEKELREDTIPVVETGGTSKAGYTGNQERFYTEVQARVVSLGYNTLSEYGIVYSPGANSEPTLQNATKQAATGDGREATIVTLTVTPRTGYSYRAYAINNKGMVGYGMPKTFTSIERLPVAETGDVVGKPDVNTAQIQCRVSNANEVTLREYGILYTIGNTTPTSQNGTKLIASGLTGATTTFPLTGLTPNTTYSYMAYATNSAGNTTTGSVKLFTTSSFGVAINIVGRFRQDGYSNTIQIRFSGDNVEVYGGQSGTANPDGIYTRTATNTYTYSKNSRLSITAVNTNVITWSDASGSYTFRRI
jgi:hypothetical protein